MVVGLPCADAATFGIFAARATVTAAVGSGCCCSTVAIA